MNLANKVKIAPSILAADFSRLGSQVEEAIQAGADWIHVDVMDGHFVPNLTIGPVIVAAIAPIAQKYRTLLDVHLMIERPERFIGDFAQAGAGRLTVHIETCPHIHRTIQEIKEAGCLAGITLNPGTPAATIEETLHAVDLVLVMSVNPGFGGQRYIPQSTRKIAQIRRMLDEKGLTDVEIEVDGGISPLTAGEVVRAGATVLVAGSAIFNSSAAVADNLSALRRAVALSEI